MSKVWRFELTSTDDHHDEECLTHVHYQTDVPVLGSEPSADTVLNVILNHYSSSGHNMIKFVNAMWNQSGLSKARVVEEVSPTSDDIPEQSEEALALVGTLGAPGSDLVPPAMSVWHKFTTATPSRSSRGGTHVPPYQSASALGTTGEWATSGTPWTAQLALAAAILDAMEDVFQTTGDVNPVIYSRTRRARGQSPFVFALTGVSPSSKVRWVRRRDNS